MPWQVVAETWARVSEGGRWANWTGQRGNDANVVFLGHLRGWSSERVNLPERWSKCWFRDGKLVDATTREHD